MRLITTTQRRSWIDGFNAVLHDGRLACNVPPPRHYCYAFRDDPGCLPHALRFDGETLWDENGNCSMVPD